MGYLFKICVHSDIFSLCTNKISQVDCYFLRVFVLLCWVYISVYINVLKPIFIFSAEFTRISHSKCQAEVHV